MANLTLSIDDKLLQAARVRAVHEGTSVNEICRKAIENYARESKADRVRRFDELMASIDAVQRDVQPVEVPWRNRQEMYDHIIAERHPTLMKRLKGKP